MAHAGAIVLLCSRWPPGAAHLMNPPGTDPKGEAWRTRMAELVRRSGVEIDAPRVILPAGTETPTGPEAAGIVSVRFRDVSGNHRYIAFGAELSAPETGAFGRG